MPEDIYNAFEDTYERPWSRQHRGLLVFLLDQSASMLHKLKRGGKEYTNAAMATGSINELIYFAINKTGMDLITAQRKDYCDILVLGYGDRVIPLLPEGNGAPVSITRLETSIRGYTTVQTNTYDQKQGKWISIKTRRPYWIEPNLEETKYTQMAEALNEAYEAVRIWFKADSRRKYSFPPIVINITDGEHNGKGDPQDEADNIRSLYTQDGHVLLFSCHLAKQGDNSIVLPSTDKEIKDALTNEEEREWALRLFNMSSTIPASMVKRANELPGVNLKGNACGFIYNGSPADLITFLRWGTQPNEVK